MWLRKDMADIFATRFKQSFSQFYCDFLQYMSELFPDCEIVKKQIDIISSDDCDWDEIIKSHVGILKMQLNKKIKYSKPVERIINEPANVNHACEYNDMYAIELVHPNLFEIELVEKYKSELSEDSKKIIWKFILEINSNAWKHVGEKPLYVPTRDEIHKNIKSKKQSTNNEKPSMTKAFQASLSRFCEMSGNADITLKKNDQEMQKLVSRWSEYAKDTVNNMKISNLCNQKNVIAFQHIGTHFDEFVLDDSVLTSELWSVIVQLNGFAAVGENIPTQMMGRIENIANKLADDIVNGRADLSSMNLSEIGQEVLSQCDEADMSKFANNIDNLLPALQSFQKATMEKS